MDACLPARPSPRPPSVLPLLADSLRDPGCCPGVSSPTSRAIKPNGPRNPSRAVRKQSSFNDEQAPFGWTKVSGRSGPSPGRVRTRSTGVVVMACTDGHHLQPHLLQCQPSNIYPGKTSDDVTALGGETGAYISPK